MSRLGLLDALYHLAPDGEGSTDQLAVYVFESKSGAPPTTAEIAEFVGARASRLPELNRRIADVPHGLDYPYWVVDDSPIHSRLVDHDLSGRTWSDCEELLGDLAQDPVDTSTQVWRLHVVRGLVDVPNTTAVATVIVLQVSHALTAGLGVSQLARALFSESVPADPSEIRVLGHGPARPDRSLWPTAVVAAATIPFRFLALQFTVGRARRAFRRSRASRPTGNLPEQAAMRAPIPANAGPSTRRAVRIRPAEPGAFAGAPASVTVLALASVGSSITSHYDGKVPATLNALVAMAIPDDRPWTAANRIALGTVDLHPEEPDVRSRLRAIETSLKSARNDALDPLRLAWTRAETTIPAPLFMLFHGGKLSRRPAVGEIAAEVDSNVSVVSVNRGPRDLVLCDAEAVFTAGVPMIGPNRSVTHGFYGLGDTVTTCVVACPDTFPDYDAYADLLVRSTQEILSHP